MAPIFESAEAQSLAAVFAQRLFYFRRGAEAEAERSGGGVVCGDGWDGGGGGVCWDAGCSTRRPGGAACGRRVSLGNRSTAVGPREVNS